MLGISLSEYAYKLDDLYQQITNSWMDREKWDCNREGVRDRLKSCDTTKS